MRCIHFLFYLVRLWVVLLRANIRIFSFGQTEREENVSETTFIFGKYGYFCRRNKDYTMNATIDISYNQLLLLLQQMPVRSQLKLGKALTSQSIRAELNYFLDVFRTEEITEEDILAEVKAVRHERYAKKN